VGYGLLYYLQRFQLQSKHVKRTKKGTFAMDRGFTGLYITEKDRMKNVLLIKLI
jgi:hypothetical protein